MPEITEARLYEAFGLKAPEKDPGQGEQVQEPAAPASETAPADTGEGAQAQEPAEPAPDDAAVISDNEPDSTGEPEDLGTERKQPLTLEQRRENAARRRQQEQQAAIDQAVSNALTAEREKQAGQMKEFFAKAGMKNTFTGQPITTLEEFDSWKREFDIQQLNKSLKDGKLTAEQLNQVIASHPAVQQAQTMIRQNLQSQAQQQNAAEQERITAELAEIEKLSAQIGGKTIGGVQDLLTMPKNQQFRGYVAKGYSFLDAYKLTHMEELSNAKAEAAKRQAINNDRGKDHLTAVGNPRGSGAASVPADQMRMFRAMNPNATDAQIQAFYNKYKSKQGG
ncbi:MAG: hypothetical protein ACI3V4_02510 [Faecousia sp.]